MEKKFETGLLVQRNNELLVDARLLHQRLQSGYQFADWIKSRINEFGFKINEDFFTSKKSEAVLISKNSETKRRGGNQRGIDYSLTIDMAKELAMLERNETGRAIRRYFIKAEKEARAARLFLPAKTDLKPLFRLSTNINGRRLYPYIDLLRHFGYSAGGYAYARRKRYPNHFVDFNKKVFVTEEFASLILINRQAKNVRMEVQSMQPVLPFNFGKPLMLGGQ